MKNILIKIGEYVKTPVFIISLLSVLAVGIWQISSWVGNVGRSIERIEVLGEKYEDFNVRISKLEKESYIGEFIEISEQKKEILGFCGHMNPSLITEKSKSSWGLTYNLNYNICELNEYSDWEKIDRYPYPGLFFKITNDFNNISTWCMAVGTFKDIENPNRILIVSRKAANELGIPEGSLLNISVRISLIEEKEWRSRKECIELYNLLEIKEMKLIF